VKTLTRGPTIALPGCTSKCFKMLEESVSTLKLPEQI
jgi:hypothetical protein